jgi:hypothetical protein
VKRSQPIRRNAQLQRRTPGPARQSRVKRQSAKRRAERALRVEVVAAARLRDGGCVAKGRVPGVECAGPLDGDEIIARSAWPGGHLVLENVQTLCRAHHEWKHAHPIAAHDLGLLRWSWERPQP